MVLELSSRKVNIIKIFFSTFEDRALQTVHQKIIGNQRSAAPGLSPRNITYDSSKLHSEYTVKLRIWKIQFLFQDFENNLRSKATVYNIITVCFGGGAVLFILPRTPKRGGKMHYARFFNKSGKLKLSS